MLEVEAVRLEAKAAEIKVEVDMYPQHPGKPFQPTRLLCAIRLEIFISASGTEQAQFHLDHSWGLEAQTLGHRQ